MKGKKKIRFIPNTTGLTSIHIWNHDDGGMATWSKSPIIGWTIAAEIESDNEWEDPYRSAVGNPVFADDGSDSYAFYNEETEWWMIPFDRQGRGLEALRAAFEVGPEDLV